MGVAPRVSMRRVGGTGSNFNRAGCCGEHTLKICEKVNWSFVVDAEAARWIERHDGQIGDRVDADVVAVRLGLRPGGKDAAFVGSDVARTDTIGHCEIDERRRSPLQRLEKTRVIERANGRLLGYSPPLDESAGEAPEITIAVNTARTIALRRTVPPRVRPTGL